MSTWTSRYSEKWPRLTALFHLDSSGTEGEEPSSMRFEQPYPQDPDAYYKFYLHPDDIGQSRSVSQYSVKEPGTDKGGDVPKPSLLRACLGAMLLFSLAGVVCVAVTLAVLLSQPHSLGYSAVTPGNSSRYSAAFIAKKENQLRKEICDLMDGMFKLTKSDRDSKLQSCNISLQIEEGHLRVHFKVPTSDTFPEEDMEKIKMKLLLNAKHAGLLNELDDFVIDASTTTATTTSATAKTETATTTTVVLTTTVPLTDSRIISVGVKPESRNTRVFDDIFQKLDLPDLNAQISDLPENGTPEERTQGLLLDSLAMNAFMGDMFNMPSTAEEGPNFTDTTLFDVTEMPLLENIEKENLTKLDTVPLPNLDQISTETSTLVPGDDSNLKTQALHKKEKDKPIMDIGLRGMDPFASDMFLTANPTAPVHMAEQTTKETRFLDLNNLFGGIIPLENVTENTKIEDTTSSPENTGGFWLTPEDMQMLMKPVTHEESISNIRTDKDITISTVSNVDLASNEIIENLGRSVNIQPSSSDFQATTMLAESERVMSKYGGKPEDLHPVILPIQSGNDIASVTDIITPSSSIIASASSTHLSIEPSSTLVNIRNSDVDIGRGLSTGRDTESLMTLGMVKMSKDSSSVQNYQNSSRSSRNDESMHSDFSSQLNSEPTSELMTSEMYSSKLHSNKLSESSDLQNLHVKETRYSVPVIRTSELPGSSSIISSSMETKVLDLQSQLSHTVTPALPAFNDIMPSSTIQQEFSSSAHSHGLFTSDLRDSELIDVNKSTYSNVHSDGVRAYNISSSSIGELETSSPYNYIDDSKIYEMSLKIYPTSSLLHDEMKTFATYADNNAESSMLLQRDSILSSINTQRMDVKLSSGVVGRSSLNRKHRTIYTETSAIAIKEPSSNVHTKSLEGEEPVTTKNLDMRNEMEISTQYHMNRKINTSMKGMLSTRSLSLDNFASSKTEYQPASASQVKSSSTSAREQTTHTQSMHDTTMKSFASELLSVTTNLPDFHYISQTPLEVGLGNTHITDNYVIQTSTDLGYELSSSSFDKDIPVNMAMAALESPSMNYQSDTSYLSQRYDSRVDVMSTSTLDATPTILVTSVSDSLSTTPIVSSYGIEGYSGTVTNSFTSTSDSPPVQTRGMLDNISVSASHMETLNDSERSKSSISSSDSVKSLSITSLSSDEQLQPTPLSGFKYTATLNEVSSMSATSLPATSILVSEAYRSDGLNEKNSVLFSSTYNPSQSKIVATKSSLTVDMNSASTTASPITHSTISLTESESITVRPTVSTVSDFPTSQLRQTDDLSTSESDYSGPTTNTFVPVDDSTVGLSTSQPSASILSLSLSIEAVGPSIVSSKMIETENTQGLNSVSGTLEKFYLTVKKSESTDTALISPSVSQSLDSATVNSRPINDSFEIKSFPKIELSSSETQYETASITGLSQSRSSVSLETVTSSTSVSSTPDTSTLSSTTTSTTINQVNITATLSAAATISTVPTPAPRTVPTTARPLSPMSRIRQLRARLALLQALRRSANRSGVSAGSTRKPGGRLSTNVAIATTTARPGNFRRLQGSFVDRRNVRQNRNARPQSGSDPGGRERNSRTRNSQNARTPDRNLPLFNPARNGLPLFRLPGLDSRRFLGGGGTNLDWNRGFSGK